MELKRKRKPVAAIFREMKYERAATSRGIQHPTERPRAKWKPPEPPRGSGWRLVSWGGVYYALPGRHWFEVFYWERFSIKRAAPTKRKGRR